MMKKLMTVFFLTLTCFGFNPVLRLFQKTLNEEKTVYAALNNSAIAEIAAKPFVAGILNKPFDTALSNKSLVAETADESGDPRGDRETGPECNPMPKARPNKKTLNETFAETASSGSFNDGKITETALNELNESRPKCENCPECNPENKPHTDKKPLDKTFAEAASKRQNFKTQSAVSNIAAVEAATAAKPFGNAYKSLNDYHIEFFERNIIKKPVVTKYSKEEIEKMADDYGVDFYKMRVMLVVEAIYGMNGEKKDLGAIKKMSLPALAKVIFETKNKFFAALTPEEKAKYDAEYREQKNKTNLQYSEGKGV
ncbi:MAG: hypothetical protein LBP79_05740 [Clostridiales bacterium]|jgi:hypothetical protein|nr:hypothetical protein [Clostridiales bacterium]